jgi:hypothetical protein
MIEWKREGDDEEGREKEKRRRLWFVDFIYK